MREINYNIKVDKLEIKKELNKIQKKDIYFVNKEILYDTAKKEDNLIRNYQMNYSIKRSYLSPLFIIEY